MAITVNATVYNVYVKLTDTPETPILAAGTLKISG